ncbi:hypothetical protein N0V93_007007 [Gnomoniopsis smithogilvyi]|uniref:CFEM domain-containing protein n=1 Tax=Gnomoniopsis smithogilvyi TaxID=1191159 RepID=A0A9W8YQR1_9PEZI|nr:hypothetical protein N0V93_007007 [Gnomoniopsis smithogilvyi]
MRTLIIFTAAWAALVSSQCFSSIPECAQSCMTNAATQSTSCGATDWTCQCTTTNQQTILDNAENCVDAACGETMWLEVVKPAVEAFCEAVDGGETCSSSSTSSGSTSTLTSTSTTTGSVSTTSSTGTATGTGTATATATATAATSSSTAGAAAAGPIGSFGMMVLGALALI